MKSATSLVAWVLLIGSVSAHGAPENQPAIEEVIVTAERRDANLQDVPIAISSFSADMLEARQVETIGDLQALAPNLSIHVGDANNAVAYIRGIGQVDSIAFFEPGVGIYLDDVYLGRAQGAFLDVVDVERIEVLRGPQGSLYGRNTVGGAIKYVSAAPTDQLTSSISATVGNYDRMDVKASVSGPLSDAVRGRLTVARMQHDGYSKNLYDGERDGDRNVTFVRTVFDGDLTANLDARLTFDYSDVDPDRSRTPAKETPISLLVIDPYTFALGQQTFPRDDDPFTVNADFNTTEFTKTKGYGLNLNWQLSDRLALKSITSYRDLDYGTELDLDGTPLNAFGIYYFNTQDQISQELQLDYQSERMSIILGLYYYQEEGDTYDGGIFDNFLIAASGTADFETRSEAVFGQIDYHLTECLTGIVGFRYTQEEKDYSRQIEDFDLTALAGITIDPATGAVSYADPELLSPDSDDLRLGTGIGVPRTPANPDTADFDNFSPKLGLKYALGDDTHLYASVSTGFKSGGFNGRLADGQLDPYNEETLITYEAGVKTQLWNDRIRLNTALFHNKYEDLQVSSFEADPVSGGLLPVFSNAGEAKMQGVEVELTALLSERLTVNANAGYLDSEYEEFLAGIDPATNSVVDLSDERKLVNAPEWDLFLGFSYDVDVGGYGSLTVTGDAAYRSKTYLEVNSSENLAQGGYTVFNASLVFLSRDETWQVILGGKNLSDKRYRTHAFDLSAFPGVELGYYNPPRTYGLTVKYQTGR